MILMVAGLAVALGLELELTAGAILKQIVEWYGH